MTNTKKTTEERFDKTFSSEEIFSKGSINEGIIKTFIKQEQSRLLMEILEKKEMITYNNCNEQAINGDIVVAVSIEDIQQIAKEWDIEIININRE